jgi:carbon monoxide dehydrogenase subunit G
VIIKNELELPIAVEDAWTILLDIPLVAPCLPGTRITKVLDEQTYEGSVQLKLGPISLSFRGTAIIEEVLPEVRSVRVVAKGREERGRGSAHARVTFQLNEIASGTRVDVSTDLNLVGNIVQYARGASVVTRTAQQLVDQFSARLQSRIESGNIPEETTVKVGSLLWKGLTSREVGKPGTKGNK